MKHIIESSAVRLSLLGSALMLSLLVALVFSVKDSSVFVSYLAQQEQDSFLAASRGSYTPHRRTTRSTFRTAPSVVVASPTPTPTPSVVSPTPTPAAVTTPTTTVSPAASALSPKYGISVGATLSWLSDAELNQELNQMVVMGVGWVRYDFGWDQIQAGGKGTYDWVATDRVVKAVTSRGMQVLPILAYTPSWARPSGCSVPSCAPANNVDFTAFATAAVTRYAPQGIHQWEVWNEPNIIQFWQPQPDATAYTTLLKTTYTAIKAQDPSAKVISGGLAPALTNGTNIAPTDFIARMYQQGAQSSFDAVGFHPYSFPAMPADALSWNAWAQMSVTATNVRGIMTSNGDSAKQIWITEFGAPTGGPGAIASQVDRNYINTPDHVDEAFQAALLADAGALLKQYSWAGPLFLYSYKDLGVAPTTNENFFGVLRYDGTQKPMYAVLRQLTAGQ